MTLVAHSTFIEKEGIASLNFPNSDVLTDDNDKIRRMMDLKRANEVGDAAQYKVTILFEDDKELKKVETTVWQVTSKSITLKYGTEIPISRIHKVLL